jgi:signal transduction histidine kinase/DNA-binding LacI/PurR family transcriptional regulator/DNA-binding response OmpR family regulator
MIKQLSTKGGRRFTIGLIATDVYEEIPRSIWQGVAEAARQGGHNLIFFAGGALNDPIGYRRQGNVLYDLITAKRIAGLILLASTINYAVPREEMERFVRRFEGIPVVSVEEAFHEVPSVLKDEYQGMMEAISHLVKAHGRRRIIYMRGPAGTVGTQERYRAYADALKKYGLPFDPNLVTPIPSSWSYAEAVVAFQAYLEEHALQPRFDFDAVAAVNDENALAAVTVLQARGVRVPDDVSITGFDDLAMAGASMPPLTTVRSPFTQIGKKAVDLLLARLGGEEIPEPLVVPSQLVIRRSCGCMMPSITEASRTTAGRASPAPVQGQGLAAMLAGQRKSIVAEMARMVGDSPAVIGRAGQLLNGFVGELEHGTSGAFLSALNQVLSQVAVKGERIQDWQKAVSALRRRVLPYLSNEKVGAVADDLWHQARVMVGEMAWRNQARKRLRSEDRARELRLLGVKLATALDMEDLLVTLTRALPGLDILRCYLARYEDPARPAEMARFVMGYDEGGVISLSGGAEVYPSSWLVPEEVWSRSERCSLLVEALYFRDEPLGFVLFETGGLEGGREGELFDALQMQISSALKAASLHEEAQCARREAEAGWQLAEERRRAAEEANQLKSRFLSMVSHELRTPLNVIAGLSENLIQQQGQAPAGRSASSFRDLERIHASARHLDGLIRDVLDLASSHVGQLKLVCEPVEIGEALKPVIEMGERMARDQGLRWRVEIAPRLPRIDWDRTRLRQVVLNLVSNAIKFTEQGEVVLRAEALGAEIMISVRDTGMGISKEEQGLIFEEFRRSDRATARGYGGLGLGLAICRRLVELGGGRIGVESSGEVGGGSTFFFTLPAMDEPAGQAPVKGRKGTVLLLAKKGHGFSFLSKRLEMSGFAIEEISIDEQENWFRTVLDAPPGAIVLDFEPASEQGWEIASTLKNNPATHDIPVLFCSLFQEQDRGAVLELSYLDKPIAGARLAQALEVQGLAKNPQARTILIVDDEENILDLHTRLVETQLPGCRVITARDGRAALEQMREELPDLVLLDLMMPEMNGFEVLERMREIEAMRTIPVVVLTSQKLSETEMQQLNQGVAAVLGKGLFSAEETLAQVEAALARNKQLGGEARRIARRAMAYIHDHYRETLARKDLAAYVGVSPEYLSTCFHREAGVTPSTYIERYRIRQAKELLEGSELNITEVALEVGFCDSSYFGRVFRREVGVSPIAYRRGERRS